MAGWRVLPGLAGQHPRHSGWALGEWIRGALFAGPEGWAVRLWQVVVGQHCDGFWPQEAWGGAPFEEGEAEGGESEQGGERAAR